MDSNEKVPKKSKGQLFKEKVGYSKTMKRLMTKHGVQTPEEYKKIRKERKKAQRKIVAAKHAKAKAGRKASKATTGKK